MKTLSKAQWYCYRIDGGAVFLNRWDQHIREFDTYKEAEDFGNNRIHLIDIKCKMTVW